MLLLVFVLLSQQFFVTAIQLWKIGTEDYLDSGIVCVIQKMSINTQWNDF